MSDIIVGGGNLVVNKTNKLFSVMEVILGEWRRESERERENVNENE